MRGSYDELKEQGLDFDEILKKYEGTKQTQNKEDDIFGDDESDTSDKEDEKMNEHTNIQGNDHSETQTLTLPPIKGIDASNNHDVNESSEPMHGSAKVYPILETERGLTDTKDKSKEVKIIVDEDKDEGNVPITIWCSFFSYGLGLFGIIFILIF